MNQSERINSFSYIRAGACIAIIVLHVFASAVIIYGEELDILPYAISRGIANCLMWAVPCFVMTTGALLLNESKELSYKKIYGKYMVRIILAVIVFCLIFRLFDMVMNREDVSVVVVIDGFYKIYTGTSWSHMWYLYMLVGLYLLLPFYRKIAKYSDRWEIKFLLSIYFIFISLLPLTGMLELKSGFYIHVSTIYPLYLFCGYAIHKKFFEINKLTSVLLILLSTEGIFLLTIIRWKYSVEVMEQLWSYSSILVVMQAVGVFTLMVRTKGNVWKLAWKILNKIDDCSFGIYLIHMIFVRLVLRYMEYNPYEGIVPLNFILLICGILAVSYVITWVMKKVPGIRSII